MQSWGYLSGLLRSEKVHSLTDNDFETYAESGSAEALAKLLEDTVYGPVFQDRGLKEFTEIFDMFYHHKFQAIKEMTPCPIVMNVHMLKHDLNNLKLCYKAKYAKRDVVWEQLSEEGTITPESMVRIVEHELWNELPHLVSQALILLAELSNRVDARQVDFLLDKAYYAHRLVILKNAVEYDQESYQGIFDLYRQEVDCENIKNLFRAKKMNLEKEQIVDIIISGGYISSEFFHDYAHLSVEDTGDLIRETAYGDFFSQGIDIWVAEKSCTILEKEIDEFLLDRAKVFSYLSVGPAVVEEALRSLLIEIKNLKLIIIGKINDMSANEIKERIRDVRL